MGKIRINDLARELEVKSKLILECLSAVGFTEKKSHSSAIEDEIADKVRAHFRAAGEEPEAAEEKGEEEKVSAAPAPAPLKAKAPEETAPPPPQRLTRTIAEIKAAARKTVAPKVAPPAPPKPIARRGRAAEPAAPEAAATGPVSPLGPSRAPIGPPGAPPPEKVAEAPPSLAAGEGAAHARASREAAIAKGRRAQRTTRRADPASSQPIYPPAVSPRGVPRPPVGRRPGPRPMHPTATRPSPRAGGVAVGGVPTRRPAGRGVLAPPRPIPPRPVVPEEVPITRKITISEGIAIKELSE
ncbi:MAG: translation initiation factor IF-2 N-terminal domain-containing protein, partial [Acidobacteria bacterium]|nr:translation initiation factor IF-2 N-terminal domain-containing protein [Acidobacteriota bacterium]